MQDGLFGKEVKDKVTGFRGIVIGRCDYLFGCSQYGIAPKIGADGKKDEVEWFDEGRIEIVGEGVSPQSVVGASPGCEYQPHPKG